MILRMVWIHIFVTLRMIKTTDDGWRMTVVLWHDGCFGWRFKSCFLNLIILWSCKLDTFSIFCQIDYHVQTVLPDFCSYLHVHYMFNPLYRDDDPNGFVHIVFVDGLKTSQCDLPGKGLCQQSSGCLLNPQGSKGSGWAGCENHTQNGCLWHGVYRCHIDMLLYAVIDVVAS